MATGLAQRDCSCSWRESRERDSQRAGLRGTRPLVIQEPHYHTLGPAPLRPQTRPYSSPSSSLLVSSFTASHLLLRTLPQHRCCCSVVGFLSSARRHTAGPGRAPETAARRSITTTTTTTTTTTNTRGDPLFPPPFPLHRPECQRHFPSLAFPGWRQRTELGSQPPPVRVSPPNSQLLARSAPLAVSTPIYSPQTPWSRRSQ
jgi:hypothetical protein